MANQDISITTREKVALSVPTYSIVIPAYNEAKTIERAIRETSKMLHALEASSEIIVVDDGSTDETSTIVANTVTQNTTLRCIKLTKNQGKGAAIKAGVAIAKGTYIAFLDADLATHPRELVHGFSLLPTHDIAIGSRRVPQATIQKPQTRLRSLAGQCFNFIVRAWLKLPYRDTQCGCKVFRSEAAHALFSQLTTTGWTFDVELLLRAQQKHYRIAEFPVVWINGSESRVRLTHWWQIVKDLYRTKRTITHDS